MNLCPFKGPPLNLFKTQLCIIEVETLLKRGQPSQGELQLEREFFPKQQARVSGKWASSSAQESYWNMVYWGWGKYTLEIHALNLVGTTGLSKGGILLN